MKTTLTLTDLKKPVVPPLTLTFKLYSKPYLLGEVPQLIASYSQKSITLCRLVKTVYIAIDLSKLNCANLRARITDSKGQIYTCQNVVQNRWLRVPPKKKKKQGLKNEN